MDTEQTARQRLPGAFSLFRPSYEAVLTNAWTFLALLLVPLGTLMVAGLSGNGSNQNLGFSGLALLLVLVGSVFALLVAPALPFVQLKSVQGKEVAIGEAFQAGMQRFWRFYGLSILVTLLTIGGLLLLIVPGLIIMRRYFLAQFYLYDRDVGILEAMRLCAADSKPFSGAIWGVIGVTVLISVFGIYPLLGLVAAALQVLYFCAPAIRYFQIKDVIQSTDRAAKKVATKKPKRAKKS